MARFKKAVPVLFAGLCAAVAVAPASAMAEQKIQIALSGTLPVRCSVRIHDIQIQPGEAEKLILTIEHKCNTGHALHLRVNQGSGASLKHTKLNYAGKGPAFRNSVEATFRYANPVEGRDQLVIEMPLGMSAAGSKLFENIQLSVFSD